MGYYINPENETKETFLRREGEEVAFPPNHLSSIEPDKALICLVDNGFFTAAGIIFSQREFEAFNESRDDRPKQWFLVKKEQLYPVSDIQPEHWEVFETASV